MGHVGGRRLQRAAVGTQLPGGDLQKLSRRQQIPAGGQAVHLAQGEAGQSGRRLPLRQGKLTHGRGHEAVLRRRGHVLLQLPQPALQPLADPSALAHAHDGILRQIVQGRGLFRVHRRQIPVAAVGGDPLPQGVGVALQLPQQRLGIRLSFQLLCRRFQRGGGLLRRVRRPEGQHLTGGQQQRLVQVVDAPLGGHVKGAHGVQLIVPEFAAHRLLHGGGEHVQDPAPQGELAGALHLLAADVARRREPCRQRLHWIAFAGLHGNGALQQHTFRHTPLHRRVNGGHHQRCLAPRHGVQRRQTLMFPAAAGRGAGPQLPVTPPQQRHVLPRQGVQVAGELHGLRLIAAQQQHGAARLLKHGRRQHGPVDGGYAGNHGLIAAQRAVQQRAGLRHLQ